MIIGVPKEIAPGERRVALIPDSAKQLVGLGPEVVVQAGAFGEHEFTEGRYEDGGAERAVSVAGQWVWIPIAAWQSSIWRWIPGTSV